MQNVKGETKYLPDSTPFANELVGYLVLSTVPHAKVKSIDISAALSIPGVVGFASVEDLPGKNSFLLVPPFEDELVFYRDIVTCVGQNIGIIVAHSHEQAKLAASKVKVEYEILHPILSIQEAIKHKSFMGEGTKVILKGDVDAAFLRDDVVIVEGDFQMGGQEHMYMETNGCIAIPSETKDMLILASSQNITAVQRAVASTLGVSQNKVTTKTKRLGGGFGGKQHRASSILATAAAVAATKFKKPVRLFLEREMDMSITGQRHPFYAKYKAAVTKTGKIEAVDITMFNNGGYSVELSQGVMDKAMHNVDDCYNIPNMKITGTVCRTNLPSNTAYRGFGSPQAMMIMAQIIDSCAKKISMPQFNLRANNFYKSNQVTHYGQTIYDGDRIAKCFNQCAAISKYSEIVQQVKAFNSQNKYKKQGVSIIPAKYGLAFEIPYMNQGGALLHVYCDGSVLISHAGVEMGQGLHTKCIQLAAETLGIEMSKIEIHETSTDKVPNTTPTAASIGTVLLSELCLHFRTYLVRQSAMPA